MKSDEEGKIHCTGKIAEVREDGEIYTGWQDDFLNTSDGDHEYIIISEGGSHTPPVYSEKAAH